MKASVLKPLSEAQFVRQILALARLCGWVAVHFRPARTLRGWRVAVEGDGVGWPDVFLCREVTGELLAFEAKVGNGRASPAQKAWLRRLRACGVPATCVWPRDWPAIEKALARE